MSEPSLWDQIDQSARRTNTVMPGLRVGRHLSIQERFDEWMTTDDGHRVYRFVRDRALELQGRGWLHYGVKVLWEMARYEGSLRLGPEGGYRLNDHFTSRLARRLMDDYPNLAGFFEVRELRS